MSSLPLAAADAGNLLGVVLHPAFIGGILLVLGVAFDVLGCIGLVRMPDLYNRLQAATKCVTLGTCGILLGTAVALCPLCYGIYNEFQANYEGYKTSALLLFGLSWMVTLAIVAMVFTLRRWEPERLRHEHAEAEDELFV